MKKIIIIGVILLLTGCWNYHELNDLAIVTGLAIDKKDDYKISLLINNSKKNSDSKINTTVYQANGKTLYEAIKNTSLSISNQVHLSHIEVLIISKEIAKNDLNNILDFLFRYPQTKNNFQLVVANNCDAEEILKLTTPNESISAHIANNLKKSDNMQGIAYQVNFTEFIKNLSSNIDPVLPTISLLGNKNKSNSEENIKQANPNTYIKIDNMAIFKKDKLIKISNENESKGINILNNKIKILGIKTNINNNNIITEINSLKTKYEFKNKLFIIKINATGNILEAPNNFDINENINLIKNKNINELNKYINDAIKLNKDYNIDLFGFNNYLDKNQINKKYDYKIIINLDINSKGTLNNNLVSNENI